MISLNLKKELKSLLTLEFVIALLFITAAYFFTRVTNLTNIPVFADEAIYVRWAQIMRAESTLRFLPLSDGKQPLFMWLVIPFLKIFSDPLFAGRFTSVMAGYGSLIGLSVLTWYITRSQISAALVALLYIITPYTLFFDRLALADSLLAMFGIWSIFIGILFIQSPRLDLAMILGFVLGGALLTKSPGLLFVLMQPVLLLTVTKHQKTHFLKILLGWSITALISFAIYNILRLGPNFHLIGARNQDYIFSFSEVLQHPLNPMTGNLKATFTWFTLLLTWPIFITALVGIFNKKYAPHIIAIFLWVIAPIIFQASIAKVYTPRYLLYVIPPTLVVVAIVLSGVQKKLKKYHALAIISIVIFFALLKSVQIITNPVQASLPERMRSGYFREWTSGLGIEDIADYLKTRSINATVVVGTEGHFGTLPDGLQIYTQTNPKITVIGIGQPIYKIPDSLWDSLKEHEVYLVVNSTRNRITPIELTHLEPIARYYKLAPLEGEAEYLEFYRLHQEVVR